MEWLVSENATVAQQLKINSDPMIPDIKKIVRTRLQRYEPFRKLGSEGDLLVNFLTKSVLEAAKGQFNPERLNAIVSHDVDHIMTQSGDFIFSTWQHTKSKLNNPSYTVQNLGSDSNLWHEDMAAKKAEMPSDEYTTIIELKGSWNGWKWVSLGRGYCSQEAKAMGHCGNSGALVGDDILSLRDPEGKAHLTFIINDGILGEMKGRANSKPSSRYHPAIVELLKHPSVHVIKGGGYAPERNFSLKDLPEAEVKILSSMKPNIDNLVKHRLQKGDKSSIAWDLSLKEDEISLEGDTVTLAKYDLEDLARIVSGDSFEYWFGEDSDRHDNGRAYDMSWNDMNHYADDEMEELMMKVAESEGEEVESAEEAWERSETVRSLVSDAYNDAYSSGSEKDAWDSLKKTMNSADDNGFWVDMENHPYRLQVHSKDLSDFMTTMSSDGGSIDLEDHFLDNESFKFEDPYNGFSGFDKELFLHNAKDSLKSEVK